ncbi:hypothetical protein [Pelagibius sp.]|uniref:hypothetical protein n=1 Tax=Pelagibius sp. TaxID=1931238 RepID=UPI00260ABF71|nr:hypothetical protein [Pelagibius sp.]
MTITALGGIDSLLKSDFHTTSTFGVVSAAISNEWSTISDHGPMLERLADGLKLNADRLVLRESVQALQSLPQDTFRMFVLALEGRTRDASEHPLMQAEASAGLVRFALVDHRWSVNACAALQAYEPGTDPLADPMYCRLVSVAHDFFDFTYAVSLLEEFAKLQTSAAQAKLERGLVEVSLALSSASLPDIEQRLAEAERWLARAVEADDERRDTRSYHLLVKSILSLQSSEKSDLSQLVDELRTEAFVGDLWDRPSPGMEWLVSPSYSLSAWVPVVESLGHIANQLSKPSWLDASGVLEHVHHLYSVSRSVRPGSPSLGMYFKPIIESAFVREFGLAAHLRDWLDAAPPDHIRRQDAERLQANVERYSKDHDPPKKL